MKVELGCGHSRKEGHFGVDLVSGVDIQMDMFEYLVTLANNSVEALRAFIRAPNRRKVSTSL